ncbi:uncharacterized protein OCT59_005961 [Rhizophagus irregularis]|uniref:Uncharacterized protein n=1 Tax=Rhizophagus irregularis (strain DAOM 181602 / DAOM 197198 / MUCL 43194) TaxID=747089 RepID=A0A2H5T6M1_RHIID|nr:hypothetical protein GLOIN_2v1871640 [Rhizophagus irregularis DAOM 181602=DAOM 197198]POG76992.1 hypothetical protein GLOIN_2v1871640 [Rhizophagus irregularis DAOM 181602=DAOM 197198]UZO14505.1 hypothetical protein OCT59_005961 [Rhizophagus irregularis]GBC38212.1 BTB/POZ protein [Rhizophagus irregularis DAOM 181602=DAOM 197198]|eukprot:XP_025183858.1 hypothetical protein GLOIN_2v1871640 [Rhizophagus irregularis DAOM 181602=DAOM 197198]
MILKFHSDFFEDISSLLNADNYNVIIKVGENEDTKEFYAHTNILRAHSQHFKYIISNDIIQKYNILTINKPNITPTVFEIILKYFYTGKFNIENQSGENNFDLLIACDDLFLEELVKYVQYYLIDKQESWIQQNFVLILNIIFNLPNFKKLQDYCISFICRNPLILFNSSDFLLLDKYILFHLLKKIHLYDKELIIWNSLIKWGIKKTPELENKNNLTKEDYGYLKNTLSIFIPLIKFTNITSDDFYDNVRPYEAIIPIGIYDDIMEYYLVKQPLLKINMNIKYQPSFPKSHHLIRIQNFKTRNQNQINEITEIEE